MSERDDVEILVWKFLPEIREVEFARSGIFEVRPSDVHLSFFQPGQRQFAGGCRGDDLDSTDFFYHVCEEIGGGIAPCEHQPFHGRFVLRENQKVRTVACSVRTLNDSVRFGHVIGRCADRHADPS